MGRVLLRDLRVVGIVGIHPSERVQPQEVVINIELTTDFSASAISDSITDCVDYQRIAEQVKLHVIKSQRFTVEALANDLAQIILADPRVHWVKVQVEKPQAIDFCGAVGVIVEQGATSTTERWACLGLGSNDNPSVNLRASLHELAKRFEVFAVSSVWESKAYDNAGANYFNAAVLIRTRFSTTHLSTLLKQIEDQLGRVRSADLGSPVSIDIDLLWYDGQVIRTDLWELAYRSVPTAELLPDLCRQGSVESLAETARRLVEATEIRPRPDIFQRQLPFSLTKVDL